MGKLEQKICLDTDVVIAILNGETRAEELIKKIENCEIFISSITLFELLLRKTNLDKIEEFKVKTNILDFDEFAARKASLIFKKLKQKGTIIDFRDLYISSIAIVNNCNLATFNNKHFERIGEFGLILVRI